MALELTGIENVGEFYSHHYLEALLESDLKPTLKRWAEEERSSGTRAPWKRLAALSETYFAATSRAQGVREPEERLALMRDLHARLLEVLGFERKMQAEPLPSGAAVPVAASAPRNGAPYLWVVEAPLADEDGAALDATPFVSQFPPGEQPALDGGASWRELLDTEVFRAEHAPCWVLLLAGREAQLIHRDKWGQGRFLRFDFGELFGRRDAKAMRAVAGLLHKDVLAPADAGCLHDTLDDNSHKHAFAVSDDLKEGARRAVELIANEAIWYVRHVRHDKLYGDAELARQLTSESLTYLYRLLFLFYVEARGGELGVVPTDSEAYRQGYSLEALRDLELTPLTTADARDGYYIHESLRLLFTLLNEGIGTGQLELGAGPSTTGNGEADALHDTFVMRGLHSPLFAPEQTPFLARCKLRNFVLQDVLRALSLSRERRGRPRGRISYAQLGINQLGAVYESLLAYSGFFAEEELVAVQSKRDRAKADAKVYFLPATEADQFTAEELVCDADGALLRQPRGAFVFRLAGRDREKSASYYTPEVLTSCLIRLALDERLGTPGAPGSPSADEILELAVCEPAMGSGAFLNEAVRQLAEAYLERKQKELGQRVEADRYQEELQRVRHHIAANNVYGVDLNPLATQLGQLSLWLNALHPALPPPWFGMRVCVGNSLVGARRAWVSCDDLLRNQLTALEAPRRLGPGEPLPEGGVFHFLLPATGMAAWAEDEVARDLHPQAVADAAAWVGLAGQHLRPALVERLVKVSAHLDKLWRQHARNRTAVADAITRHLPLWGQPTGRRRALEPDEAEAQVRPLRDPGDPGQRLCSVMDYWCALWFWPVEEASLLPSANAWLDDVEALLEGARPDAGRLRVVDLVAANHRFFHWEMEFAEVFAARGGFDIVLGNPPWIRVQWQDQHVLADLDPLLAVRGKGAISAAARRAEILRDEKARALYLNELVEAYGTGAFLRSPVVYPHTREVQTNLYKSFIERSFDLTAPDGTASFVHFRGLFTSPSGGELRERLYRRMAIHLHFVNMLKLFPGIEGQNNYELSVFRGRERDQVGFRYVANLFHPRTLDESLEHDGAGEPPGIKTDDGAWEIRGHADRVLSIDRETLALFAALFEKAGTPALHARLPHVHSRTTLAILQKIGRAERLEERGDRVCVSRCMSETQAQRAGLVVRETAVPRDPASLIVSGPHFFVANPRFKTPNERCASQNDYTLLDHERLPPDHLPRSNYQPIVPAEELERALPTWRGRPISRYVRHLHREMAVPTNQRTLIPALLPTGPAHLDTALAVVFENESDTIVFNGLASSLPWDFFVKSTGTSHVHANVTRQLPASAPPSLRPLILARTLRLNCLTSHYAEVWSRHYDSAWRTDGLGLRHPALRPWGELSSTWTLDSPLRNPLARRCAEVELDALGALALGLTDRELCTMYRVQFPVLRQADRKTFYDARGRIVHTGNRGLKGVGVSSTQWREIDRAQPGDALPEWACDPTGPFAPPFVGYDREGDMSAAWRRFAPLVGLGTDLESRSAQAATLEHA